MEANPKIPTTENGKRKVVNGTMLPALVAPGQVAIAGQATAILLPKWRAALAKAKTGTANAKLMCIGDSTTFGVFSNGTSTGNLKPNSWPTQLAALFNSAGINAHANSFFGSAGNSLNGTAQTNASNDSRVSLGSGWTQSIFNTVGGAMYGCSSATGNFSFTPTVPVDTFTIYYVAQPSAGTFAYNINGGTNSTQSTNAANAVTSVSIAGTLGMNTLNLNYSSGSALYIVGVEAYDSSKTWVSVMNAGWPASQAQDWSTVIGPYSTCSGVGKGLNGIAPALTIIDLGINDMAYPATYGVYMQSIQALITTAQLSGDVLLQSFNPVQVQTGYAQGTQNAFAGLIYSLAAKNNVPILDIYGRYQSYTVSNANGLMGDHLHPNAVGYADKASAIFNFIGSP